MEFNHRPDEGKIILYTYHTVLFSNFFVISKNLKKKKVIDNLVYDIPGTF